MFNFEGFFPNIIYHHYQRFYPSSTNRINSFYFVKIYCEIQKHQQSEKISAKIVLSRDQNRATHVSVKRVWPEINLQQPLPLIAHLPYENRLQFIRKHLYELWSNIFHNTNVQQTKLIIGTTIRRNMKLELARTCPPLSKIKLPRTTRQ